MEIQTTTNPTVAGAHQQLMSHPMFGGISSFDDIRIFMQSHVFAVWDFFSLLKRLQREVTCVEVPWFPRSLSDHARFILEIVISEESDEAIGTGYLSHFELYLSAMSEVGADRSPIDGLLERIADGIDPIAALDSDRIPAFAQAFVSNTLKVALYGEPHEVAASFCHGRENLLSDVLTGVQGALGAEIDRAPIFKHYVERHITLDHDEHGPLALKLLDELCGGDEEKVEQANKVGVEAIEARGRLWDGILAQIQAASG